MFYGNNIIMQVARATQLFWCEARVVVVVIVIVYY